MFFCGRTRRVCCELDACCRAQILSLNGQFCTSLTFFTYARKAISCAGGNVTVAARLSREYVCGFLVRFSLHREVNTFSSAFVPFCGFAHTHTYICHGSVVHKRIVKLIGTTKAFHHSLHLSMLRVYNTRGGVLFLLCL